MMFTLVALQVNAGPNCGAKTDATGAKAELTGSKASCSSKDKAACMAKYGMSEEECKAMCKELGAKFELTQISIKGMTCGSCENTITAALTEVPGVVKVIKVSHADGTALVAIDPAKSKSEFLTKAIADKGFSAEIIPAVARFDGTNASSKLVNSKSCSKGAGSAGKGCCAKGARGIKATTASSTSTATQTVNVSSGGTK